MQLSYSTVNAILTALSPDEEWQWCGEYGEPGYETRHDATTPLVVLGNYWCHCHNYAEERYPDRPLHGMEVHHPRVFAQLESQGVEFEWYDEWTIDYETDKAYRTQGDSYSWMPTAIYDDLGELLTPDSDIEQWVDYVVDNPSRCLLSRVHTDDALSAAGFVPYNGQFESGWYPGQTDDPKLITEDIRRWHGDSVQIVFRIDSNGQFDTRFSAWIRGDSDSDSDEVTGDE